MQGKQPSTHNMMMLLSGLVCFLVLTAEAGVGHSSQQSLPYDLMSQTGDFEERNYGSVKWASANETSFSMDFTTMDSFKLLSEYFSGANGNGTTMEMTFPILLRIPFNISSETAASMISFLLPAKYQTNPPNPLDDMHWQLMRVDLQVSIHGTPNMTVFAKRYSGMMTAMSDNTTTAINLSAILDLLGLGHVQNYFYAAVYNR
ncbi:heme-binding protein 1-like [Hippoglossus stenolepis]|uniref:heme-binding protein 1-like n=1 Tax=Hippoglossus stenolepis TaxID=195615 RepID=UPI001FAF08E0|nr:heme-binding protein 1-like [Hippoglossus stenolepis]